MAAAGNARLFEVQTEERRAEAIQVTVTRLNARRQTALVLACSSAVSILMMVVAWRLLF